MPVDPSRRVADIAALTAALAALDPEGLVACGCPADEYGPEAAALAEAVADGHSLTGPEAAACWADWFGPHCALMADPAAAARVAGAVNRLSA